MTENQKKIWLEREEVKKKKYEAIKKTLLLEDKTLDNPEFIELTNLRDSYFRKEKELTKAIVQGCQHEIWVYLGMKQKAIMDSYWDIVTIYTHYFVCLDCGEVKTFTNGYKTTDIFICWQYRSTSQKLRQFYYKNTVIAMDDYGSLLCDRNKINFSDITKKYSYYLQDNNAEEAKAKILTKYPKYIEPLFQKK